MNSWLAGVAVRSSRDCYEQVSHCLADTALQDSVLTVENRQLTAKALAGSVVWFDFARLCSGPRSLNDDLDLASRFHAIILSDVPKRSARQSSKARRFIWLVDVFNDHQLKSIVSAE